MLAVSAMGGPATAAVGGTGLPRNLFGYDVLAHLGKGAGSTLYAVSDPATRQVYALKYVCPADEKGLRFVEQLESEHAAGRLVNHPGLRRSIELKLHRTLLRKVIDAGLVLELFDGLPLESAPRPRSLISVVRIFAQVADAVGAMHALGYIHCDLKPNNILVDAAGHVKVIDLGQACRINTVKERIQGTPDYIAPEQVKREPVTPRTDVYNLGATLYWALCRKNLPTLFTLKKSQNSFLLDAKLPTPRDENPSCPPVLNDLVMDCVRVNPAKRPELADVIRRLALAEHVLQRDGNGSRAGGATSHAPRVPVPA